VKQKNGEEKRELTKEKINIKRRNKEKKICISSSVETCLADRVNLRAITSAERLDFSGGTTRRGATRKHR
jgi:hypothetical protein